MSKELEAFRDILGILSAVSGCEVDMNSERIITVQQALQRLESIDNAEPSEALEYLEQIGSELKIYYEHLYIILRSDKKELISNMKKVNKYLEVIKQALQRLNKYEQVLGNGRLTDRNYKNTTLNLDSCKPYLRLGQLEDIYEEGK